MSDSSSDPIEEYRDRAGDDVELLGVAKDGDPYYHDPIEERLAPGVEHGGGIAPRWESGHDLGPDRSLEDVVEEIEESVGWDQLTEYAHDLLGDGED